jgi:hypothetical protein
MCAYRALAMLTWIRPGILTENQPWVGDWTRRDALLTALTRLHVAIREVGNLQPLADAAEALERTLRARWPECADRPHAWPALVSPPVSSRK